MSNACSPFKVMEGLEIVQKNDTSMSSPTEMWILDLFTRTWRKVL